MKKLLLITYNQIQEKADNLEHEESKKIK